MTDFREAWLHAAAIVFAGATLTAILIVLLRPLLLRYALARPNARSSHVEPTPQGGGMAVVAAMLCVCAAVLLPSGASAPLFHLAAVAAASVLIAAVGAADDIRTVAVLPRLLLQTLAVSAAIVTLPADIAVFESLPQWLDRALLVLGGVWFVNAVNFMDGLDWMTVAEFAPLSAALALFAALGALPPWAMIVALALLGGTLGFAPFNRPVARLFLGDVGSLPLGLVLGWLLVLLAGRGHLAAALLLPLYYIADAGLTLLRRMKNGERFWEAHRTHFYQRATERGFTVPQVVGSVFMLNVVLCALAAVTLLAEARLTTAVALSSGAVAVGLVLFRFDAGRR